MKGYLYRAYNREYARKYREEHREQLTSYRHARMEQFREYARKSYWKHRDKILEKRRKLKEEVLTRYGGRKLACVICQEVRMDCLSIDHVEGRGKEHRSRVGAHMYQWLKSNNYPEGYQTLCMNCQWIKRIENKEFRPRRGSRTGL